MSRIFASLTILAVLLIGIASGRAAEAPASLKKQLTDTIWVWANGETIVFLSNGKVRWKNDIATDTKTWTWSVADSGKRIIKGIGIWKHRYRIVLDADLKSGVLYEEDCPERPTRRLEKEERGQPAPPASGD